MVDTVPWNRNATKALFVSASLVMAIVAAYGIRILPNQYGFDDRFTESVNSKSYAGYPDVQIHSTYTGIPLVDYVLRFLVVAFLPGATGFHSQAALILQAYFLLSFFPLLTIYTIEAGRRGALGALTSYTSIFAIFYQTVGGAIIIPILHLLLFLRFLKPEYYHATNRVPVSYAKVLQPALILGYLIPTCVLYLPFQDHTSVFKQRAIAFWQITPFFVNALLVIGSRVESALNNIPPTGSDIVRSLVNVKTMYFITTVISTVAHSAMIYAWQTSDFTLNDIFKPNVDSLNGMVADGLHHTFQLDFIIIFSSGLLFAFLTVSTTSNFGAKENRTNMFQLFLTSLAGCVLAGPAATISGLFLWREQMLQRIQIDAKLKQATTFPQKVAS